MGQKSGSAWLLLLAGAGALYAAFSHHDPAPPPPAPAPTVHAAVVAPTAPVAPAPSAAELILVAKRMLLLTHTGNFRSRDLHGRALAALELIPANAPEYAEATQLRRGIIRAYTSKAGTPPLPDNSPLSPELVQAVEGPIALARTPASDPTQVDAHGAQPAAAVPFSGPALANAHPIPQTSTPGQVADAPGCAENGSCYADISSATGLPKTTAVHGYTKADGTYVRGYYRSR